MSTFIIIFNRFIRTATIAVKLYNWHSKTTNYNKLIKKHSYDLKYNKYKRCIKGIFSKFQETHTPFKFGSRCLQTDGAMISEEKWSTFR